MICGVRSWDNGYAWVRGLVAQKGTWGSGNILCLSLDVGYRRIHFVKFHGTVRTLNDFCPFL